MKKMPKMYIGNNGRTTACMVIVMMSRNSEKTYFSDCVPRWAMPRPNVNAMTSEVITLSEAGMATVKYGLTPSAWLICVSFRSSEISDGNKDSPTP